MVITQQNWLHIVEEILTNLQKIGVDTPTPSRNYRLKFNGRATSRFGKIKRIGTNHYEIELNSIHNEVDNDQNVKNTVIHEIIHSLPGCMNHGFLWKEVCDKYNRAYNTQLSRTSIASTEYMSIVSTKYKKYTLTCNKCKHEWQYSKNTKLVKMAREGKELKCPWCGDQTFTVIEF